MKIDKRIKKRIKCCGRLTKIYFRDKIQHCFKCSYDYDFDGNNLGFFGSGLNEENHKKQYKYSDDIINPK